MYLTIDIGNTRTKAAVFDASGELLLSEALIDQSVDQLQEWIITYHIKHVITSATGDMDFDPGALSVSGKNILLNHLTPLPLSVVYTTPETLGRDRMAAACGAMVSHPGEHCLVIDAGTCITMDMVLGSGIYLGGNIAPGLHMRLKAMHQYTAKLPLAAIGWPGRDFGDSTVSALQNGACLGAVMEIEGMLQRAKDAFGTVLIVMTGGDAPFLAGQLESEIFVEPELVMKGLFKILSLNV